MIEQRLSDLIGATYDAALDPALWPDVLGGLSDYVGGCAASIYSKNSVNRTADIAYNFGVEDHFQQIYVETYVRMDPTTVGFFFFDADDVITIKDIVPSEEFLGSRFYREWVKPQGWIDMATSVLEKSSTSYAVFSVFRHEDDGFTDDAMRQRMRLLAPHIRRATFIGNTIQLHRMEAASLTDTLDSLTAGLFLVDAGGRLVQANRSGRQFLSDGAMLRTSGGRLHALDPAVDEAIQAAVVHRSEGGGSAQEGTTITVSSPEGQPHLVTVLPLTTHARRRVGFGSAATSAIFVSKAQVDAPLMPELIARVYGLTPGELRVLLAVFESNGVPEIAEGLGISEATAKTHLHRLFSKTGTKRQADLVKLVAGFVGPNG